MQLNLKTLNKNNELNIFFMKDSFVNPAGI